jgi:TRAP-type C4-dicarboxylate transport system permease small subunit|tara:strand:+ start:6567 stop:7091 length:525 start_codon:yes stop_codon:yes gene_type:complete
MGCFVSMRKFLDKLYLHSAHLASFFLLLVLTIIVTQMLTRWTGFTFPGATAYAGYAMAGSAFFALAHTLNEDGHIRVKILLHRLGGKRRGAEIWCYSIGSMLSVYFFYYSCRAVYFSLIFNDISQSEDAWPVWIPQLVMVLGVLVMSIAFLDRLYQILFLGYEEVERVDDKMID